MNKKERDAIIDTDGGFITGAIEATGMGDGIALA